MTVQKDRRSTNLADRVFGKAWLLVGMSPMPQPKTRLILECIWRIYFFDIVIESKVAQRELEENRLPKLVSQASGIVVEIGPGSGNQASRYDTSRVTKIYGIEPNADLHDKLRVRIKAAKLNDIYTIVPCGIENVSELEKYGITGGSVDTVLTCQVLCSVPQPEEVVRHTYRILKRGGKLIAYEHIRSYDMVSRTVQSTLILFPLVNVPS